MKKIFSLNHPLTLGTMSDLEAALDKQGKFSKADQLRRDRADREERRQYTMPDA